MDLLKSFIFVVIALTILNVTTILGYSDIENLSMEVGEKEMSQDHQTNSQSAIEALMEDTEKETMEYTIELDLDRFRPHAPSSEGHLAPAPHHHRHHKHHGHAPSPHHHHKHASQAPTPQSHHHDHHKHHTHAPSPHSHLDRHKRRGHAPTPHHHHKHHAHAPSPHHNHKNHARAPASHRRRKPHGPSLAPIHNVLIELDN